MASIKFINNTISYESRGKGETILFLHGLGSRGEDWRFQLPAFRDNYQVITVDLPGHGNSQADMESLTIDNIAESISHLLDKPSHIVGLSFGSFIALKLALLHPEKVKSLTLFGSTCRIQDIGRLRLFMRQLAVKILPLSLVAKAIAFLCFPKKEQKELRTTCQNHVASVKKEVYLKLSKEIFQFDVSERFNEIQCPVLIVAGRKDHILPPRHAEKLHRLLPNSELHIIETAGHIMPIDSPTVCNQLLQNFIRYL